MKKLLILIPLLLLISCKTKEVKDTQLSNSLIGVVYDNKSNPVQGAKLFFTPVGGNSPIITVSTDIDGKFLVPSLEFGEYAVNVTAKDCSDLETTVDHRDIENVLIVKVSTKEDLIDLFKKHLFNKNIDLAKEKMDQIEQIDSEGLYYNYLKSMYYIEAEMFENAEELLLSLVRESEDDPYVNLLLADLYQYHVMDNEKALKYLKRYIRSVYTDKEANRIKELEDVM